MSDRQWDSDQGFCHNLGGKIVTFYKASCSILSCKQCNVHLFLGNEKIQKESCLMVNMLDAPETAELQYKNWLGKGSTHRTSSFC